ncbi:GvpL/GvpF family gas vesicle protein [Streptomyces iconiensis]|uniref:GvpL/GvpF family gas vesicle protein n=1 Tax=Streptomyces iconiensis TaxID=1384038 RepID=A0ABT6ZZ65_9ACTN|nr:GvpL/GvpF family gas vesicle protein [Streptomyces iconiensis]MDJ1134375.1 GvpL/GvpF family gas vesicle protein [Streptomyces iconiensis]
MSTYVYGIARVPVPSLPEDLTGVGDPPRPVRVLEQGDLFAVVSEAPENLTPKRRELLAHQRVLSEAGATKTVLPMRFGSVSDDDETVTGVLADRAAHFLERLDALEGMVEYNIKATHEEEAVLHRVMADQPELRAASEANRAAGGGSYEERLRLGEMVASAVQAREAVDADTVRRTLAPLAHDVSEGPESMGWLANFSFLVDHDTVADFAAAVEDLRMAEPQLELRLSGPLPPYSFVDKTGAGAGVGADAGVRAE